MKSNRAFEVPADTVATWQIMANLMAEVVKVPAGLIMRIVDDELAVFVSSHSQDNPYHPGDSGPLQGSGLYCETVINTKDALLVPDALSDDQWKNNPDIKLNLVSYLGFPILMPDGSVFGTICVLDSKRNAYSETYKNLIVKLRDLIQSQLALLYMNWKLGDENMRLTDYMSELQELRDIIPICMHCKAVKNDEGFWERVEDFFERRLHSHFSHGICQSCIQKYYPELAERLRQLRA